MSPETIGTGAISARTSPTMPRAVSCWLQRERAELAISSTSWLRSTGWKGRAGRVRRPSIAEGDVDFYRYIVVVAALMFLLALVHVASKPGRAWASIRESEPAALAAGVNITFYKMWAFALASFLTGVAGGLLAANSGQLFITTFPTSDPYVRRVECGAGLITYLVNDVARKVIPRHHPGREGEWLSRQSSVV